LSSHCGGGGGLQLAGGNGRRFSTLCLLQPGLGLGDGNRREQYEDAFFGGKMVGAGVG
jgi:hypothetical protein